MSDQFLHFLRLSYISSKLGGRLCSFSPCIEQVQKATTKMRSEGFTEISTFECLLREFQPRKINMPLYDHNKESSEYEDQESKKRKLNEEFSKKDLETLFITGIPLTNI